MASNAASSVQFRVNGTEMARGRTRKTERSQSMDPRAKPRAAGRLKGKRRDNRDEREFILGPENAGNFCIARRSRGISAIVSRRLPRSRLSRTDPAGQGDSFRIADDPLGATLVSQNSVLDTLFLPTIHGESRSPARTD